MVPSPRRIAWYRRAPSLSPGPRFRQCAQRWVGLGTVASAHRMVPPRTLPFPGAAFSAMRSKMGRPWHRRLGASHGTAAHPPFPRGRVFGNALKDGPVLAPSPRRIAWYRRAPSLSPGPRFRQCAQRWAGLGTAASADAYDTAKPKGGVCHAQNLP